MFSPALATLEIPPMAALSTCRGTSVSKTETPLQVAVRDRALLLLAGADNAGPAGWPSDSETFDADATVCDRLWPARLVELW